MSKYKKEKTAKHQPAKTNEHHTIMFKELINQNDSQQQRVAKKISELQEKQSTGLKGQALLDHLAATTKDKEQPAFLFMPPVNRNANYIIKSGQSQILKHEIELKVLQYEAELLKELVGKEVDSLSLLRQFASLGSVCRNVKSAFVILTTEESL